MARFQDFSIPDIADGSDLQPSLEGKVILAVNVASECGFTPQYVGLEALHSELGDQGLTLLGFPCDQFGAQEPGSDEEILEFCTTNYGVTFPMTRKIDVNGADRHPVYAWLTSEEGGCPGDIEWNFEKFLIGRDGNIIAWYPSATKPQDATLLQDIADAL